MIPLSQKALVADKPVLSLGKPKGVFASKSWSAHAFEIVAPQPARNSASLHANFCLGKHATRPPGVLGGLLESHIGMIVPRHSRKEPTRFLRWPLIEGAYDHEIEKDSFPLAKPQNEGRGGVSRQGPKEKKKRRNAITLRLIRRAMQDFRPASIRAKTQNSFVNVTATAPSRTRNLNQPNEPNP